MKNCILPLSFEYTGDHDCVTGVYYSTDEEADEKLNVFRGEGSIFEVEDVAGEKGAERGQTCNPREQLVVASMRRTNSRHLLMPCNKPAFTNRVHSAKAFKSRRAFVWRLKSENGHNSCSTVCHLQRDICEHYMDLVPEKLSLKWCIPESNEYFQILSSSICVIQHRHNVYGSDILDKEHEYNSQKFPEHEFLNSHTW